MIGTITIKDFKSIIAADLPLGNVNVFIGADGSGKLNILEAVGVVTAECVCQIEANAMVQKGIRIAKPDLVVSPFYGQTASSTTSANVSGIENAHIGYTVYNLTSKDIYSTWTAAYSTGENREDADTGDVVKKTEVLRTYVSKHLIYSSPTNALHGLASKDLQHPLRVNGEGLDVLLNNLPKEEIIQAKKSAKKYISWIEDIFFDSGDMYKMQGYKSSRSKSNLYFRDKFMQKKNSLFSTENISEGVLELLFCLTLFISKRTPDFFAIDNIENGPNPRLCRFLMREICELVVKNGRQILITTHNPVILDGLNLNDDSQRLFVVTRNDEGKIQAKCIQTKKQTGDYCMMFSEMWMEGLIGGVPNNFRQYEIRNNSRRECGCSCDKSCPKGFERC